MRDEELPYSLPFGDRAEAETGNGGVEVKQFQILRFPFPVKDSLGKARGYRGWGVNG